MFKHYLEMQLNITNTIVGLISRRYGSTNTDGALALTAHIQTFALGYKQNVMAVKADSNC